MPAEPGEPLSEREIEVVRLVAAGCSNKEIAARLVVSPNTVKVHLRNIFAKTGVTSRTELTVWALRQGWVALASSSGEKGPQATAAPAVAPFAVTPAAITSSASVPAAESALLRGPEAAASLPEGEATPPPTARPSTPAAESALLRGPEAAASLPEGEATPPPTARPSTPAAESALLRGPEAAASLPEGEAAPPPTARPSTPAAESVLLREPEAAIFLPESEAISLPTPLPSTSAAESVLLRGPEAAAYLPEGEATPPPTARSSVPSSAADVGPEMLSGADTSRLTAAATPPAREAAEPAAVLSTPPALPTAGVKERWPGPAEALLPLPRWPRHRWLALGLGWLVALFILLLPTPQPGKSAPNPAAPGIVDVPQVPGTTPNETSAHWQERAPMSMRRARLALATWEGKLYAIGGLGADGVTALTERYDPAQDTWESLAPRPLAAANIGAATLSDGLLVPGGCDTQGGVFADVHRYDPLTDTWHVVAPLPEPRCGYALAAANDQVYLLGGWDGTRYTTTFYRYDAATDRWERLPAAPTARGFGGAAMYGKMLYYVGGYNGKNELTTCEVYDLATGVWTTCPRMLQPRGGMSLVTVGAHLYAIGGGWQHYVGFNESYDPKAGRWTVRETPIVGEWRHAGVVALGTTIYAVGGWNGDYLNRTYRFDALPFQIYIPVNLP